MNLKYYCVYVQFNWLKRIPSTYEIVVRVGLHVSYIWIVISVGQRSRLISGRSSVQVGYDPLGLQCWMPSPRSTLKGLGSIPQQIHLVEQRDTQPKEMFLSFLSFLLCTLQELWLSEVVSHDSFYLRFMGSIPVATSGQQLTYHFKRSPETGSKWRLRRMF